ncbi:MAG: single-stranded-DNA-specific exonuclease RecJ [Gemmatimonadetes bacterium]|nr:single-stranded-DNA-specific exonuclease RecJ [Gemmatimonadota bacterium]MDA1104260.1 single-stranded-DNA-specific exonuclease RecJ [Gemmatimonadota bacterium]
MTSVGPGRADTRLRPPDPHWSPAAAPDAIRVTALEEALGLPEALCAVLVGRGLDEPAVAKQFLRPRLDDLHDPALLVDGVPAAARIADAIRAGETIFVHGDYDVDGICATALLTRWLRALGGQVVPFVPHRQRDGYDFSPAGLNAAIEAGASLIVTADCGTVAHDTIAAARSAGIEVIVTDHHTVSGTLPDALAVVNPQRDDCPYPEKGLCGTGLAFKVCQLVGREIGADNAPLEEHLDLVALATVADLVPLRGENRILVRYGLRRFADTRVPGIRALLAITGVEPSEVTSGQLGFVIAPRINAVGRIGEAMDAVRLLLTDSADVARSLAMVLDETNKRRRDEDQRTLDEALEIVLSDYDADRDFGVVLAKEGWHPGVIGIVASRVVERIHRPVVMIALSDTGGRGSARSIPGFDLYAALAQCSDHLVRFGGHRQAAGMDVRTEAVADFRDAFNTVARERLQPDDLRPVLRPDLALGLEEIDLKLVHWLEYLSPHGMGNPGPLFMACGVALTAAKVVGANHMKLTLRQDEGRLDAIGFGFADRFSVEELTAGSYDVLFRVERNEWRGRARPQAKLVDLRPAGGHP